jgi:hypothetical protein
MSDPLDIYETPTDEELITITWLDRVAERLGNPPDLDSETGWKLMDAIMGVWQKHFPQEVKDWTHDRQIDLDNEKSLSALAKDSSIGINIAGYPPTLFKLIKVMFPNMRMQEKKMLQKLTKKYPIFKTSNYS